MKRRSRTACSLLVAVLMLAVFPPVTPAAARPVAAARSLRASLPHRAAPHPLALDDEMPGVAISPSPYSDSLNELTDADDIFQVQLEPGETLDVSVMGPAGDVQFVAELYQVPSWDTAPVVISQGPTDLGAPINPQTFSYTAGTSGIYYLDVWSLWGSGAYTLTWSVTPPPITMKRLAGGTRYETALAISREAYADGGSRNVLLATGVNFADALAASALAGSYDCPILLTSRYSVSTAVIAEIDRLRGSQPTTVTILGSDKAVSESGVAQTLRNHGNITVKRIAGPTRYETAVAIGKEVRRNELALGHSWSGDAFVVKGSDFPDALAAAPIAAHRKMPILLVATLPPVTPATAASFSQLGIGHAYVCGSPSAVSDWVMNHLGVPATRIQGSGRMETAVAIASYAVDSSWASSSCVGITTSSNFPDALGGGALMGKMGGVMLLTKTADVNLSDTPWQWVFNHQTSVAHMRAFGSNAVVPDPVFPDFLDALKPVP
ncbi:MAG TPA: cell wall-binding repeat-containing protein [Coriobacteriia bacterium]|jgi:putative cell wall-binding protein